MGFKGDGADVAKTGVQSGAVVEDLDVIEDRGAGFGVGGEAPVIDQLVFEAAPKRFNEGVVVAVALAAHGGDQAVLGEHLSVGVAGKLGPTIRMHDQPRGRPSLRDSHLQGGDGQRRPINGVRP